MNSSSYSKLSKKYIFFIFLATLLLHALAFVFLALQKPINKHKDIKKPTPIKINFVQPKKEVLLEPKPEIPEPLKPIEKPKPKIQEQIVKSAAVAAVAAPVVKKLVESKPKPKPKPKPKKVEAKPPPKKIKPKSEPKPPSKPKPAPKPEPKKIKPKSVVTATNNDAKNKQRLIDQAKADAKAAAYAKRLAEEKAKEKAIADAKAAAYAKKLAEEKAKEKAIADAKAAAYAKKLAEKKAKLAAKGRAKKPTKSKGGKTITATYKHKELPEYPKKEEERGRNGSVTLEFVIGLNGKAKNIKVVNSTSKAFSKEAIKSIKKSTFVVEKENGVKIERKAKATQVFSLN